MFVRFDDKNEAEYVGLRGLCYETVSFFNRDFHMLL